MIYMLIRLFGRVVSEPLEPWLDGPFGDEYIGDTPYERLAKRDGLAVTRHARQGGLVPDFSALDCDGFTAASVHPEIRRFYEHTAEYRMDVQVRTSFPASIGLWLLVATIGRKVNQLNFPLGVFNDAYELDSEIILYSDPGGGTRVTGWCRRFIQTGRIVFTGFYMTVHPPDGGGPCIKAVFPMPRGNATVILRPKVGIDGSFRLSSDGAHFGESGFYRVQRGRDGKLRAWHVRSLREHICVFVNKAGILRCDHTVRFLGLPVLRLRYLIERC